MLLFCKNFGTRRFVNGQSEGYSWKSFMPVNAFFWHALMRETARENRTKRYSPASLWELRWKILTPLLHAGNREAELAKKKNYKQAG